MKASEEPLKPFTVVLSTHMTRELVLYAESADNARDHALLLYGSSTGEGSTQTIDTEVISVTDAAADPTTDSSN